jgi:hypothetical protein
MIYHPSTLIDAVSKLPIYLQNKWCEKTHAFSLSAGVCFSDLVAFVDEAAVRSSAKQRWLPLDQLIPAVSGPSKVGHSSHGIEITACGCVYCGRDHNLAECADFRRISMDERREFVRKKKLCFACFGQNHFSIGCASRLTCSICSKRHPTVMHEDGFKIDRVKSKKPAPVAAVQNDASVNNAVVQVNNGDANAPIDCSLAAKGPALLPILPVRICQAGSQKSVVAFALYDTGSSGTFMSSDFSKG